MSGRQYITDKILQVRKDICKYITEEMTIKQAYKNLGYTDMVYNSFYQQCKALIVLGYLQECGYYKKGRTHSLLIISINNDYVYEMHEVKEKVTVKEHKPGLPRIYTSNDRHWPIEKKKSGRVFVSGSSLSAVMLSANY